MIFSASSLKVQEYNIKKYFHRSNGFHPEAIGPVFFIWAGNACSHSYVKLQKYSDFLKKNVQLSFI